MLKGATSCTRLKACDHYILRSLIGWKVWDRPYSLHTRRWRPKDPNKLSWMNSLHWMIWIMFHDLLEFVSCPPPSRWARHKFKHTMLAKELLHYLDESQGPSQLHGHYPWLVCEVALSEMSANTHVFHMSRNFPLSLLGLPSIHASYVKRHPIFIVWQSLNYDLIKS
jgi:hypothetical protein